MDKLGGLKLLGVAAVLEALMAVTGGLVISQATGGQSGGRASVNEAVGREMTL